MADPISTTASVLALVAFTHKIIISLTNLSSTLKGASHSLKVIGQEVTSLHHILTRLHDVLAREAVICAAGSSDQDQAAGFHLQQVLDNCRGTLASLHVKVSKIQQARERNGFEKLKIAVSWSSMHAELKQLRLTLERQKTAILLWLNIRGLEMLNAASEKSIETKARLSEMSSQLQRLRNQELRELNGPDQCNFEDNARSNASAPVSDASEIHQIDRTDDEICFSDHDFYGATNFQPSNHTGGQTKTSPEPTMDHTHSLHHGVQVSSREGSLFSDDNKLSDHVSTPLRAASVVKVHSSIGSWLSTFAATSEPAQRSWQHIQ